jgi:hypothetical protein
MDRILAVASVAAFLAGCAGISAKSVPDPAKDTTGGFRYYEGAPFLLLYTDGKAGLTSKVLYLPDTTRLRSIEPYSYLANNTTTLKFDHGRLTSAKVVADETAIPTAIISGLEKIALEAAKAANAGEEGIPGPYLFRLVKEGTDWKLAGGQAIGMDGKPACVRFQPTSKSPKCGAVATSAASGGAK